MSTLDLARNSLLEKSEKAGWYIEFTEQGIFTKKNRYIYIGPGKDIPTQTIISKKLSELATLKKDELRSSELGFKLLYVPTLDLDQIYNDNVINLPGDRVRIRMNYLLSIFDYPKR